MFKVGLSHFIGFKHKLALRSFVMYEYWLPLSKSTLTDTSSSSTEYAKVRAVCNNTLALPATIVFGTVSDLYLALCLVHTVIDDVSDYICGTFDYCYTDWYNVHSSGTGNILPSVTLLSDPPWYLPIHNLRNNGHPYNRHNIS